MSAIPETKRLCANCAQERIVCRHNLCELCDGEQDLGCFAKIPSIRLKPREQGFLMERMAAMEKF